MKNDRLIDLGLTGYEELFMSTEERLDAKKPKVEAIPLAALTPFRNHPFKVKEDEEMAQLMRSMEQYMMAAKAELFGDSEIQEQILKCSDPKQIKALGRKVRGFDQKVWDKFKYAIVLNGNWCKFSQNRDLREFLLSTGDSVLVEASPYDNIWGIRLAASSPEAQDPMKWRGQNLLGFALMEVRDELRRVTQNEMLCDWNAV